MTTLESNIPELVKTDVVARIQRRLALSAWYARTYTQQLLNPRLLADLQTYCMFIGHGRSGHSIIGALLDAHPNIILPDEVDALRYLQAGFSREQIGHLLVSRSRTLARRNRRKYGRDGKLFSFEVPGQWQGRFSTLRVLGDSKAGISTQRLADQPALLDQLRATLAGINLRVMLVLRNPYDNISTLILRGSRTLDEAIERYFTNCQTLTELRDRLGRDELLVFKQEQFIADPGACLERCCRFVGVEMTPDYLAACTAIVYKSPARSRTSIEWTTQYIDEVRRRIKQFDFLAGYSFET
jgi:hypothetical protein